MLLIPRARADEHDTTSHMIRVSAVNANSVCQKQKRTASGTTYFDGSKIAQVGNVFVGEGHNASSFRHIKQPANIEKISH